MRTQGLHQRCGVRREPHNPHPQPSDVQSPQVSVIGQGFGQSIQQQNTIGPFSQHILNQANPINRLLHCLTLGKL